jgi:hypothetical protein
MTDAEIDAAVEHDLRIIEAARQDWIQEQGREPEPDIEP